MEKFFEQYFGEHYTMAFFHQDTMVCDLDSQNIKFFYNDTMNGY